MSGEAVPALVLAGVRAPDEPVAAREGVSLKAFAHVGGRPMIEHVLAALDASGRVGTVHVALPGDAPVETEAPGLAARFADGRAVRVPAGVSPVACVLDTLDAHPHMPPLLVVTGDHPMLPPGAIARVLDESADADAAAGFADTAAVGAAFPGARRTTLRFRDGGYSGCNVFALMTPSARRLLTAWRGLESKRKRPWRLALSIGPGTVARYLLGRLTLRDAVARFGRGLGVDVRAVVVAAPQAAIDVDKLADLDLVRAVWPPGSGSSLTPRP